MKRAVTACSLLLWLAIAAPAGAQSPAAAKEDTSKYAWIAGIAAVVTAAGSAIAVIYNGRNARLQMEFTKEGEGQKLIQSIVQQQLERYQEDLHGMRDREQALDTRLDGITEQRNALQVEVFSLKERIAVLERNHEELKLQREQSMNRMRYEIEEYQRQNRDLTIENTRLKAEMEGAKLRADLAPGA